MRNGVVVDLGEIDLDEPAPAPVALPPRPRWPLLAGALALTASVLTVAGGGSKEHSTTPPAPSASTTVVDAGAAEGMTLHSPYGLDETVLVGAPAGYQATGSLATLDVAAGRVRQRLREVRLWPGDFQVPMLTVGDRLVWADLQHAWSVPIGLDREPVRIGDASYVAPARDRDHVWLVQQTPMRVTEVGPDGEVRRTTFLLPPGARPVAGVDGGLLVDDNAGAALLDDATGVVVRRYDDITAVAAFGDRALTSDAELVDLATGERRAIDHHEPGDEVWSASFSPDGRYLALVTDRGLRGAGIEIRAAGYGELLTFNRIDGASVVWERVVWSGESDAVYFLASGTSSSADRVLGIRLGGTPQTVAVLDDPGWYWLAVD